MFLSVYLETQIQCLKIWNRTLHESQYIFTTDEECAKLKAKEVSQSLVGDGITVETFTFANVSASIFYGRIAVDIGE